MTELHLMTQIIEKVGHLVNITYDEIVEEYFLTLLSRSGDAIVMIFDKKGKFKYFA